jgi:CheY-like chemotaxis protein
MSKEPYILIVDDDPDIIEGILTILESRPYRLATARDGKKCIEMVSEPRYARVPILILTTVIEDASRRRYELETGMAMDVQDYVQKPAKPDDLIKRVEKLLKVYA